MTVGLRCERRFKRYEKPLPCHQLQIDVEFLALVAGRARKYYPYNAIDDCTRIRIVKIFDANTQQAAITLCVTDDRPIYS